MLELVLNKNSLIPLYIQIRDQIIETIDKGILTEGNQLPPSRELARDLGLNRTTVYKAYRELWSLGYLDSRPGSYSTVRSRPALAKNDEHAKISPQWTDLLSNHGDCFSLHYKEMNLAYDFRSFSPDPSLVPIEVFRRCYNDVLKEKGRELMGYGHPGGYKPLLEYISELMSSHKIEAPLDELIITSGAQNALDLICRLFRRKNWSVIVEEPGYSEANRLFQSHGASVRPCPIRPEGPDIAILRELIKEERPSFFFTIPNFQNPTGFSSVQNNREELLALCEEFEIPIIEDGYSQDMRGTLLSIKSMDKNNMVIYVGTFSKVLFPGVRTGWVYADKELIKGLMNMHYLSNVSGNISMQAALERFCRLGYYDLHLKRIHKLYRKRMDAALSALNRHFPEEMGNFTRPNGGYYLWISLADGFPKEEEIYDRLMSEGIGLRPGSLSMIDQTDNPCFRLSTAHLNEEKIEAGIKSISLILREIRKDKNNG